MKYLLLVALWFISGWVIWYHKEWKHIKNGEGKDYHLLRELSIDCMLLTQFIGPFNYFIIKNMKH
jgi:hypothetical protein